jgi:antitoxin ParD1/3/4
MVTNIDRDEGSAELDAAIARGIADAKAGRVKTLAEVFDRLEAKFKSAAKKGRHPAAHVRD